MKYVNYRFIFIENIFRNSEIEVNSDSGRNVCMNSRYSSCGYSLRYSSYLAMASFIAAGLGAPLVSLFSTQVFKEMAS